MQRQMELSEKAQYGILPSTEPTPTFGQGKTSTKSSKVTRKPLPTMKGSRNVPFVKSTLISYLIDRIDTETRTLIIHGNIYSLTRESFEAVMGLLDGGEEMIVYDDMKNNPFKDEIVGANGRTILSDLVIDLQKSKKGGRVNPEEKLGIIHCRVFDEHNIVFPREIFKVHAWLHALLAGYVDKSVLAVAFWSCANIRRVVRYIRRFGGYESVKVN
ncbi:hypothetical protein PanWU01x14_213900 [Parasponia andersonii]|uniref:Uncharacterized protein n=1 Tax=Parasponia andersonii TaxID=3476 RepID=A0A2P5BST1_PARAD|nr:hypothetical protein PanWU01x14_213900 [Parasponia andersonii]